MARRDLHRLPDRALLDGAMGTGLMARGLRIREQPPELWNVACPEVVRELHLQFVEAGADALQTNSFGASRLRLRARGLEGRTRELNLAAAKLARAAHPTGCVLGSMGPTGELPLPEGAADLYEVEDAYAEQAALLAEGGVDILHVETMCHSKEARAAIRGARQGAPDLPLAVSMSCKRLGDSFTTSLGYSAETMIAVLLEESIDAIGVNCTLGPGDLLDLATRLVETGLPVIAQPTIAPETSAPLYPGEFATGAQALFAVGVRAVGGCCGTSPADIASARDALR
jgi:methionine synthase I (cobalamin-dependent)